MPSVTGVTRLQALVRRDLSSTMITDGAARLRVEACALGRFFCSANEWTRVAPPHARLPVAGSLPSGP